MARAWITDRWTRSPIDPKTKEPRDPKTSLYGKGLRWRVDWYEPQPDGTKRLRSKSFRTKPLAESHLAKVEHDIRSGAYRPAEWGKKTIAEVGEQWLATKRKIKPATKGAYRRDIRMWIAPAWGAREIASITRAEVEQWITELENGTAAVDFMPEYDGKRDKLGPSRVKWLHGILSGILGHAVRHGWIPVNVARGIELSTAPSDEPVFLSFMELEALIKAAPTPKDRALIALLGYGGLRLGEALALQVSDLDNPAPGRVTVRRTLTLDENGKRAIGPTKTGKDRIVPVPPFVADELRPLAEGRAPGDFLFRTSTATGLNPYNWRAREWKTAVIGAGLDEIGLTPYKLRHTAASMAIAAGADVLIVQTMLGHADATETLNRYGHLWPDRLDEVIARITAAREVALDPHLV